MCATITKHYRGFFMKWTNEHIIETIRLNSVNGICKSTDVGMNCTVMARRRFGSFSAACEEAGVKQYSSVKVDKCCIDGCETKPRSTRAKYCEKHYYRMRREGTVVLKSGEMDKPVNHFCLHCGEKTNGNLYCSMRCSTRHYRSNPSIRSCEVCGDNYYPDNKGIDFKVCSKECDVIRHKNYNINQKAKERVESKELYQYISFFNILKSKHVLCEVCGSEINMKAVFPAGDSFTIDHIKPLSRGGSHSPDNVRPAHLSCNIRLERGSKVK